MSLAAPPAPPAAPPAPPRRRAPRGRQAVRDRFARRVLQFLIGSLLLGIALATIIEAGVGVDPWNVLHQGISDQIDVSVGTATVLTTLVLFLFWIPLRLRLGVGTILNGMMIGPVVDFGLHVMSQPHGVLARGTMMLAGIFGVALGTSTYVGAGFGPGSRDGLMTGLADVGIPIRIGRTCIEVTVVIVGFVLGGQVGVGTIAFALLIGPLVHYMLPRLTIGPRIQMGAA